jgi:hypothetical protein
MKKVLIIAVTVFLLCAVHADAAVTLSKDFNTGTLTQNVFSTASLCNQPRDAYLTADYATDGGMSVRFETRKTDVQCFSYRAELYLSRLRTDMMSAEWFAFDTYVPASQPDDTRPESHAQYHQITEIDGSPPWGLWYENGVYKLVQQFTLDGQETSIVTTDIPGTYPKGAWHKWVVHYKRSIGSDGLLEVWVDGQKRITRTGPNANQYLGTLEPTGSFKFGIYKWVNSGSNPSTQESRVVYVDNVKLGDSASTIADFVAGTPPPTIPPDTTAPTVRIAAPLTATTVSGTIALNAVATDTIGVTKVEFYKDRAATPFATDTTSPFATTVDTTALSNGQHIFAARAYDAAGNTATSTEVWLTVTNTATQPPVVTPPVVVPPSSGGGGGGNSSPTIPSTPLPSTPSSSGGGGGGGGGSPHAANATTPVVCLPGQMYSPVSGKKCTTFSSDAPIVSSSKYDFGPITLRVGSRGDGVKELQRFLNRSLHLGLKIDGILGPKTIAVMKTWQLQHGLVPDGLIGPKTKALMNQIAATQ